MAHQEQRSLSPTVRKDCAERVSAITPGVCPTCGRAVVPGDLRFRVVERIEGLMDEDSFLRVSTVIAHCKNCAA